ncbi:hypothetical protein T459_23404 [Capsicum annuum]|uniref:Ubiquitin-like protease family profile domain-containing protein n=1 Tax=Capsicum annuum TaxID=4072 RepID=A0A2G2YSA1_CAPAN|nr:hypothetical protein FXO37_17915 [Capsicum annuum]PHT72619.1 hypothetical protein T459_23404 [Capsicum annuum]
MLFFLTLRSAQTLSDPKVVDRIKIELFGATIIIRKIILESRLVVVDDGSGSGSGAAVGDNDAPLIVFETTSHYDYDHTSYINFSTSSKYSVCKCQDCKAKHDGVINAINALTASVKEMTSKRSIIPSKRISYLYTPLEIKMAKKRRKDISRASSSIEKSKIATPLSLFCTAFQCTRATGEQHKLKETFRPLPEIQNLAKILPTFLDMSDFLNQKVRTDWSMIEAYWDKMGKPFDVQYAEGIAQQIIGSLNCSLFIIDYAEYLSDGLQVPNNRLNARLLHKIYVDLLWKYGEAKAQKLYTSDIKDPRRPKLNFIAPDEEQLVHIE